MFAIFSRDLVIRLSMCAFAHMMSRGSGATLQVNVSGTAESRAQEADATDARS